MSISFRKGYLTATVEFVAAVVADEEHEKAPHLTAVAGETTLAVFGRGVGTGAGRTVVGIEKMVGASAGAEKRAAAAETVG